MVSTLSSTRRVIPVRRRSGVSVASLVSVVGGLLLLPAVTAAQESTTRGFSLGVQLQGISLAVEDGDPAGGGGLGLRVGYGLNRIVTAFLQVDGSQIDVEEGGSLRGEWGMAQAEIGARFHFANALRRWVPWLEVAAGTRAVQVDNAELDGNQFDRVSFNGGAVTLGGGLSAYLSETLALDISLKWSGGQFTEVDLGEVAVRQLDIEATSSRFGVGVVWWP
jgi:hypothetical protein